MEKFIPLSVPNIKGNELKYVTEALESEWVSTGGGMIEKFEMNISNYVKSQGAVACQSGTAGIHLVLNALGIGSGDVVIVPTLTFIAAVNPVKYVQAEPVFMDCDDSLCLDPVKLKNYLQNECEIINGVVFDKSLKKAIKAIVVVHVFGNMCDMEEIMNLAEIYNLYVIEDATEALGTYYTSGKYKGMYAGTIGSAGIYSFNGNKIITTGGGGMVVSNSVELLSRVKYLSTQAKDDQVNFIHNEIGFNYRMTNIQAAMGIAQLEQLEVFIETKKENYFAYKKGLENFKSIFIMNFREDTRPNYWFYSLVLNSAEQKNYLIHGLSENEIQSRPIWGLISEQVPYKSSKSIEIKTAKQYYDRIVNIPCSTNLSEADVLRVIKVIKSILGA